MELGLTLSLSKECLEYRDILTTKYKNTTISFSNTSHQATTMFPFSFLVSQKCLFHAMHVSQTFGVKL
jgi:hypothetical protein